MARQSTRSSNRAGNVRRIAFYAVVVLASLFLLLVMLPAYPLIVVNWFPQDLWLAVRTDHVEGDAVHRLHSLALAVIAWGMLLGIVLQVHRPDHKISALLASLAVPIAIAISEIMAGTYTVAGTAPFLVLVLIVILMHPSAKDVFRLPGWNIPMLVLAAAGAVPWVMYAAGQGAAAHNVEPGFEVDHLTFMSALALLAVLWGIIGASNRAGWQYAAGASMVATASAGLQSVVFPDVLSGLPLPWAVAASAWCVAYGCVAILRWRASHPGSP